MKYKNYILTLSLGVCIGSLMQAETLMKGTTSNVEIEIEKEIGKFFDDKYQYEIELSGVDEPICEEGLKRIAILETANYVTKFKNPVNGGWCYFFPEGKTPH